MMIIDQLKIHVDNEASRFDDRLHRTMEAITGEGRVFLCAIHNRLVSNCAETKEQSRGSGE